MAVLCNNRQLTRFAALITAQPCPLDWKVNDESQTAVGVSVKYFSRLSRDESRSNYYDLDVAPKLVLNNTSFTRGNSLKLLNHTFHYDLRKYSFPARIVNVWNSLPNTIVQATSIDIIIFFIYIFMSTNKFDWNLIHSKTDLIGFAKIKNLSMIDYTADLIGAGSRASKQASIFICQINKDIYNINVWHTRAGCQKSP